MSTEIAVFLRPIVEMNRAQVVSEVARAAGVELRHGPDIYEGMAHVGVIDQGVKIELFVEVDYLVDDVGMPFSSHPYELDFRPFDAALATIEQAQRLMEPVYDRLKETGLFSLFATYDGQYVLRSDIVETRPGA
ncbi:hypothetical protein [Pseudonocardia acaciae]|uniref:hypothetical protein n=1 Tax=Pseudonocardia acaciae TaxID=551276 RepID=UPI00048E5EA5|nr:hypothetical protein [Pseudonocardia acaciae]